MCDPLHRRPVSLHRQDDRPTDADAQVRLLAWSGSWMNEPQRQEPK